jgi:hypothetical protein
MGLLNPLSCKQFDSAPRTLWRILCALIVMVLGLSAAHAQTSATTACTCQDIPDIQDRLQKLQAIKQMALNILGSAGPNTPASQQQWLQFQNGVRQYLQYVQMQNPGGSTGTSLFNGTADPFCGTQANAPTACMNDAYSVHQVVHAPSCHAGTWKWQVPWTETNMLQEEVSALQFEIDFLQSVQCGLPNNSNAAAGQPPSAQIPSGMCPAFQLNVQVVTTTAISMPGMLNEQSGRSLNNGQGISVPLVFNDDGSFEGVGSGTDAGAVSGAAPNEVVNGKFGHMQSVMASGVIEPGSCTTQPCQPDLMHVVLVGGPSQQITQAQARGALNRNLQQTTPTGAAQMQFDLPAYVGGSVQRPLLATGIINSNMTVNLLQAQNGTAALPEGSSLLYELQKCRTTSAPVVAGGGAGVVIPGIENLAGSQNNGAPVTININETIHAGDVVTNSSPVVVTVNEAIHVSDSVGSATGLNIVVNEPVHVTDAAAVPLPATIQVKELVHVGDAATAN